MEPLGLRTPSRANWPAVKRKPGSRVVRRVNSVGVRVWTSSRRWRANFASLTVILHSLCKHSRTKSQAVRPQYSLIHQSAADKHRQFIWLFLKRRLPAWTYYDNRIKPTTHCSTSTPP